MKLGTFAVIVSSLAVMGCKGKDTGKGTAAPAPGAGSSETPKAGSASPSEPSATMTTPHGVPLTGAALAKHHAECTDWVNAGKFDQVKEHCVHPDIVVHEMDYSDFNGAEAVAGYYQELRGALPDWKLEPQLVLVSGRDVLAVNLATGKHTGPLKLHDGTERKGSDKKVGMLVFQHLQTDDKNMTLEQWEYMDHHSLLDQLGVGHEKGGPTRAPLDKPWAGAPLILVAKNDDALEKGNLAVVTKRVDAFNAHKPADAAALLADDAIESDQAAHEDRRGKAAIENGMKELLAAFPDAKLAISNSFASGDYVVVEGLLRGTHKGPFGPLKPTNKAIDSSFAEVIKVKDGKISEIWRFRDGMALVAQLTATGDAHKGDAHSHGAEGQVEAPKGAAPKPGK